jgi:hypothetical protein
MLTSIYCVSGVSLKSSQELNHDIVILIVLRSCYDTNVVDIGQLALQEFIN